MPPAYQNWFASETSTVRLERPKNHQQIVHFSIFPFSYFPKPLPNLYTQARMQDMNYIAREVESERAGLEFS